jgi:hypothetical protein
MTHIRVIAAVAIFCSVAGYAVWRMIPRPLPPILDRDGKVLTGIDNLPRDEIRGFDTPEYTAVLLGHAQNQAAYSKLFSGSVTESVVLPEQPKSTDSAAFFIASQMDNSVAPIERDRITKGLQLHLRRLCERLSGAPVQPYVSAMSADAFTGPVDFLELLDIAHRFSGAIKPDDDKAFSDRDARIKWFLAYSEYADRFRNGTLAVQTLASPKLGAKILFTVGTLDQPPWSRLAMTLSAEEATTFLGKLAQRGFVASLPNEQNAKEPVIWLEIYWIVKLRNGDMLPLNFMLYYSKARGTWHTYAVFRQSSPRTATSPPLLF